MSKLRFRKKRPNKDDNSDDVEQGNNEFIKCFHQFFSPISSTIFFSQFEKRNKGDAKFEIQEM